MILPTSPGLVAVARSSAEPPDERLPHVIDLSDSQHKRRDQEHQHPRDDGDAPPGRPHEDAGALDERPDAACTPSQRAAAETSAATVAVARSSARSAAPSIGAEPPSQQQDERRRRRPRTTRRAERHPAHAPARTADDETRAARHVHDRGRRR